MQSYEIYVEKETDVERVARGNEDQKRDKHMTLHVICWNFDFEAWRSDNHKLKVKDGKNDQSVGSCDEIKSYLK